MSETIFDDNNLIEVDHHKQQDLCTTRQLYRQGKKLTAVKVYTINNESKHLLIYGVPKINLRQELKQQCTKFGTVKMICVETKYKTEIFTECYHVLYERIQSARIAKRLLDTKSFYGGVFHVCYAPEYETISETREKLEQRRKDVAIRLNKNSKTLETGLLGTNEIINSNIKITNYDSTKLHTKNETKPFRKQENRKRKHPAIVLSEDRLKNLNKNEIWKDIPREIDPRISSESSLCKNVKTDMKKHYTIQSDKRLKNNLPSYGPVFPNKISNITNQTENSFKSNLDNNSISKSVLKKHICQNVKRIVFMNNKNKFN